LKIKIVVGDVLAQEGNVVLGSNDTFDTSLSDDIISPKSVQGQLLQRVFAGDIDSLDDQISTSLAEATPVADPDKTFGKTDRYPIGTVAIAAKGNARSSLTIWIAENDASEVDLAALDRWLRDLCAA
jgi:hypothetical protein